MKSASQSGAVRLDVGWKTDIGRVRQNNEDAVAAIPGANAFVISDGMGGEAHGEVASALAVEMIVAHIQGMQAGGGMAAAGVAGEHQDPNLTAAARHVPGFSPATHALSAALHAANQKIFETAQKNPSQHGMGATLVAAWVNGHEMSLVNVGDSRAYLVRDDVLEQLTEDHTLVAEQVRRGLITPEQAKRSRVQNVLMRALGVREEVEADLFEEELKPGDIVLLCTDGLTRMVEDEAIATVLKESKDAQGAADRLVALALEHGGEDNVTVLVMRVSGD